MIILFWAGFDLRNIIYTRWIIERPILETMHHMLNTNVGLIAPRQYKEISGAFITKNIIGHKTVSSAFH